MYFYKKYNMKYPITNTLKQQEFNKACKLSELGYTKKEIVENTIFPTWRVLEFYMKRNGLKLPYVNMPKKHKSNVNIFDDLKSFKSAYLLGITYADGCIYNNHRFGYCLAKQDEKLIDYIKYNICPSAIKKEIHNKTGAKNRQKQIILRISEARIVKTLKEKWGVFERKTTNEGLVFPNIQKEYIWNFILGIIDGDGNIFTKPNINKQGVIFRITICLTDYPFIKNLQEFLIGEGIDISLYSRQGKTCKYYLLQTTNIPSAIKICENIYKNYEFCLKRKYQKYKYYLELTDNTELNPEITKGSGSV